MVGRGVVVDPLARRGRIGGTGTGRSRRYRRASGHRRCPPAVRRRCRSASGADGYRRGRAGSSRRARRPARRPDQRSLTIASRVPTAATRPSRRTTALAGVVAPVTDQHPTAHVDRVRHRVIRDLQFSTLIQARTTPGVRPSFARESVSAHSARQSAPLASRRRCNRPTQRTCARPDE